MGVEKDSVDDFATPDEKIDPLFKMLIEIGENIDVFTDLDPIVIIPLQKMCLYQGELTQMWETSGGKGPNPGAALRRCILQYMRLRASMSRKSRGELVEIQGARNARLRESISYEGDAGNQGGTLR